MRWPPPGHAGSRSSLAGRPAAHFAAERQRLPLLHSLPPESGRVADNDNPADFMVSGALGAGRLTITVACARWGAQAAPVRNPVAVPDALKHGLFSIQDARRTGLTPDQLRGRSYRKIARWLYGLDRVRG